MPNDSTVAMRGGRVWYFAYGSNLCTAQMAARTGVTYTGANRPRRVRLPGYRLVFNMGDGSGQAFANIMRSGDGVLGVLYQCSEGGFVQRDYAPGTGCCL